MTDSKPTGATGRRLIDSIRAVKTDAAGGEPGGEPGSETGGTTAKRVAPRAPGTTAPRPRRTSASPARSAPPAGSTPPPVPALPARGFGITDPRYQSVRRVWPD